MNTIAGSFSALLAAVVVSGLALAGDAGLLTGEAIAVFDEDRAVLPSDPTVPLVRVVLDQVAEL